MADKGRFDFYIAFTVILWAFEVTTDFHKFSISSHTALNFGFQTLRRHFKVTYEYEFHILRNRKVGAAKDHGKNCKKVRPSVVRHLYRNRLFINLNE